MINLIFGYLLLVIVTPFWLLGGVMVLFSYPDDNKDRYPWNIIPLRLGVQGLLLPFIVLVVPIMGLTFPIWYYGGALMEEAFKGHKVLFIPSAVAAYFASQYPSSSGKLPSDQRYCAHEKPEGRKLVDIRPYVKDIPESVLQLCPQDLRAHHLEHIWVPFCKEEFLDMLLRFKDGKITEGELALPFQ